MILEDLLALLDNNQRIEYLKKGRRIPVPDVARRGVDYFDTFDIGLRK